MTATRNNLYSAHRRWRAALRITAGAILAAFSMLWLIGCGKVGPNRVAVPFVPAEITGLEVSVACGNVSVTFVPPASFMNGKQLTPSDIGSFAIFRAIKPPRPPRSAADDDDFSFDQNLTVADGNSTVADRNVSLADLNAVITDANVSFTQSETLPQDDGFLPAFEVTPPDDGPQPLRIDTTWEPIAFALPGELRTVETDVGLGYQFIDTGQRFRLAKGQDLVPIPPPSDGNSTLVTTSWLIPRHDYIYRIFTIDQRKRIARMSPSQRVTYAIAPEPPTDVQGRSMEDAIVLEWAVPEAFCDGSPVLDELEYLIYREAGEGGRGALLGTSKEPIFKDREVEDNQRYRYYVRARLGGRGARSEPSEEITVTYIDSVGPSPANRPSFATGSEGVSLFWTHDNAGSDLTFHVERATDDSIDSDDWKRLTEVPLRISTFLDRGVVSGRSYRYRVVAVDDSFQENEGEPSPTITVAVP